jgi:hypothetical protein
VSHPVEIHVPISPTQAFFQEIHYLAVSIHEHGGRLRDAPIVVSVGEDCDPFDIASQLPWTQHYPVEFRWLPRERFRQFGQGDYFATGLQRHYCHSSPYVLLLDADMVFVRDIDDLLDRVASDPAIYTLPGHGSPFQTSEELRKHPDDYWWRRLFEEAGLGEPRSDCEYLGHGVLEGCPRHCPPYFSLGFVLAPAELIVSLGDGMCEELGSVDRVVSVFRSQIAHTLTLVRRGLPWRAIPLRYNFPPALRWYLPRRLEEWRERRILHYSSYDRFNIQSLMSSETEMDRWLSLESNDGIEAGCRELFRGLRSAMLSKERKGVDAPPAWKMDDYALALEKQAFRLEDELREKERVIRELDGVARERLELIRQLTAELAKCRGEGANYSDASGFDRASALCHP